MRTLGKRHLSTTWSTSLFKSTFPDRLGEFPAIGYPATSSVLGFLKIPWFGSFRAVHNHSASGAHARAGADGFDALGGVLKRSLRVHRPSKYKWRGPFTMS